MDDCAWSGRLGPFSTQKSPPPDSRRLTQPHAKVTNENQALRPTNGALWTIKKRHQRQSSDADAWGAALQKKSGERATPLVEKIDS